ncbi:CARD- and ANK-domain containing inflammasome adapter protein [Acanthochromis polyacanthus]|uniref:CARD- and ANK-domain containing inflammasome adapter protein n=1 Tax=Acanthochromis polyacanthus TaxID=80966 RepID=UPI002233F7FC|nr:CARD- and ANK-domain containing inflammasome adapter protein [Acanthochromis polyacanthus]
MISKLKGSEARATSNYTNPYAVDVIKVKRRDLIYGISHTEDLLDLLVTEGAITAEKRSVVLTIRTHIDQNSRVLDILEARGERACRKFFHPCLMLAEPDLYQRIKTYVGSVNEYIQDSKTQLIGYLLEKDNEGMDQLKNQTVTQKIPTLHAIKEAKRYKTERAGRKNTLLGKEDNKPAESKSENLIHMIAANGEVELLEELLGDTDINTVNASNETLLHAAAEHGHLSIIQLLIHKGARLDLQDNVGHTALHKAASMGHTDIMRVLIKAGASIHTLDLHGKNPIHLAVDDEHLDSVKILVEEEVKQSESHNQDMFLHMAAMEDNCRLAELLLQNGAAVDAINSHEKTALFNAVKRNNEKMVKMLLKAGASVDQDALNEAINLHEATILQLLLENARVVLSEEALGSALLSAVRQNHDGAVTTLIDNGADVNICDKQGYTPVLLSAELGHTEVFRVLAAKQAKLDTTLPDLSSALHLAVHGGSIPIVQNLLEQGTDPNVTGAKGQMPLHLAAQCNRAGLTGLLLEAGAQVNAVNQDGLTPLHVAGQQGHSDTVIQLLQGKADPKVKDRQGRTALHWAAASQEESCVVDLLLSAKTNPNITDNEKKTALHVAAAAGQVDAVTSLLSYKAKAGTRDMDGSTPLHYAAAGGHAGVVSALLHSLNNKGIEDRNAWRKTPLHAAAEKGHDNVVGLLLEAGAKINSTDQNKDTPLHCAARGGHQEVMKRLVNWGQAGQKGRRNQVNLQSTNNVGRTALQLAESGDTPEHENIVILLKKKMFLTK